MFISPAPSLPHGNGLAALLPKPIAPVKCPLHTATPSGFSKPLVSSGLGMERVSKSSCIKHLKVSGLSTLSASCYILTEMWDNSAGLLLASPNDIVLKIQRLVYR